MLQAAQKHVKSDLKNRRIQVQEKLLLLYTNNLSMVNIQAAFLCGFAFGELSNTEVPKEGQWWGGCNEGGNRTTTHPYCDGMLSLGAIFHSLALACNLLAVCSSTLSSINGPGLALRGLNPESDVERAVAGMKSGHRTALQLHMVGMMFFFLGVLQSIWFRFNYAIAIVSSAILGAGVLIFLHVYRRQQWRFSLTWNKED